MTDKRKSNNADVPSLQKELDLLREKNIKLQKELSDCLDEVNEHKEIQFEQGLVQEMTKSAIWTWDIPSDTIIKSNEYWKEIYEMSPKNVSEQWSQRMEPEDQEAAWKPVQEHMSGKTKFYKHEFRMWNHDRTRYKWIRNMGRVVKRNDKGEPVELVGTSIDISDQKERERELLIATEELNHTQSLAKLGSWYLDTKTNEVTWTPEIYRMYGFDPGKPPPPYTEHMKLFTKESWDTLSEKLARTASEGTRYDLELEMSSNNSNLGWMRAIGEAVKNDHGEIIGLRGAAQDITETKKREGAFKAVVQQAPYGIALVSDEGKPYLANKALLDMLGYSEEELRMKSFKEFTHEEDFEKDFAQYQDLLDGKIESYTIEKRYIHKDGSIIPASLKVTLINEPFAESGKRALAMVEDLTERKKNEKFKDALTENSSPGLYVYDFSKGLNVYMNKGYEEILGWNMEEVNSMKEEEFIKLFHPDDLQKVQNHMGILINDKKQDTIHYRFRHKEGYWVHCYSVDTPYEFEENGNLKSFIGSFTDVTELRKKEDQLIKANEMAVHANKQKDIFLSSLSHEIRTPMNAVLGFSKLLKKPMLSDSDRDQFLELIDHNSQQLLRLIDDILDITKLETSTLKLSISEFDLSNVVKETIRFHTKKIADFGKELKLELISETGPGPHIISSDETRLRQVLNNLLDNAIKYSQKGTITFLYRLTDAKIYFEIKDQGVGIEKQYLHSVFNRYERHVLNESGTGLGLTISKGIVEKLGGEIEVESELNVGSTFSFVIPRHSHSLNSRKSSDFIPQLKGVEKILYTDDSSSAHILIDNVLEDESIEIVHAYDGEEAVEIFKESRDFDLVLMDIMMPVMDGKQAFREIRAIDKDIPVVAQTAFAMNDEVIELMEMGFSGYMSKPINIEQFKELVAD